MPKYHVTWEIDVDAGTPVEAAEMARHYQIKPGTTATVFDVLEHDSSDEPKRIDLTAMEEDLDLCRDCGSDYPDGGDGYNGRCPDCADKAEAEGRADD